MTSNAADGWNAVVDAKPTGARFLPPRLARLLHLWSAREQLACPHPAHRIQAISGDERNYGYRFQCMECGVFAR